LPFRKQSNIGKGILSIFFTRARKPQAPWRIISKIDRYDKLSAAPQHDCRRFSTADLVGMDGIAPRF